MVDILLASAAGDAAVGTGIGLMLLVWIALGAALYFLPSILAYLRKKQNFVSILLLNAFLGWSLIGWVVSLVWAVSVDPQPAQVTIINQSAAAPQTNVAESQNI